MDSTTLRQQLGAFFGDVIAFDEKLVDECVNMCQIFNLSAEDLFYKWEAFNFNSSRTTSFSRFTMESAHALKSQIQRDIVAQNARKVQTKQIGLGTLRGIDAKFSGKNIGRNDAIPVGGVPLNFMPRLAKPIKAETFAENVAGPSKVSFKAPVSDPVSRKRRAYKYMYEKMSERSEALDDRIDEAAEIVREHYKIHELGDPASSTEEDITVVGRIVLDSDSSSGPVKLNEASLALESSRMMGSGARVSLKFHPDVKVRGGAKDVGGIGLFPGAIAALRGKNGGGGWFLVNEVLAIPPMKPPPPRAVEGNVAPDASDSSFSVCIVSGPYTPDMDLHYRPWHQFFERLKSTKPSVVLLLGPFIDCAHPGVKNGDTDQSPTQLFKEEFSARFRDFFDVSPNSIVLLVPSIRDIISSHAVFPQCELGRELAADPRVICLPNPCRFSVNGVSFALTTVDVLFHLRKEEFFKKGGEIESIPLSPDDLGNDTMANLCRHLLQQRSFYPIFPVPLDLSHEVNLDVSHAEGLKLACEGEDEFAPNILILPSRLKGFSKVVHDTMAINPSSLTKGQYATLNFEGKNTGSLKEQFRVEVMKL